MAIEEREQSLFEQAIQTIAVSHETGVPSYMVAADTLNTANGNKTFAEGAADIVESIPRFIGLAALSGLHQIENIPADIGNLVGGEYERINTADVVNSLDNDLGKFYEDNQGSIDLVGFMASSLIPGTAGVKMLNAGQVALRGAATTGRVSKGLSLATGLLAPNSKTKIAAAVQEVVSGRSVASLTKTKALQAIRAGAHQAALEGIFFETAVSATMFNSPVLEDMDRMDFIKNIAFSASVFGAASGVVSAVKLNSSLKIAQDALDNELKPWTFIPEQATASHPFERVALDYDTIDNMAAVPILGDADKMALITQKRDSTIERLHNFIRSSIGEITVADNSVTNALFNIFRGADQLDRKGAFIGLMETGRVGEPTKYDQVVQRLKKKRASGKQLTLEEAEKVDVLDNTRVGYAKLWGEGSGTVSAGNPPTFTQIVDTLGKNEVLEVTRKGVFARKGKSKRLLHHFNTKYNNVSKTTPDAEVKPWTMSGKAITEVNARYIWASKLSRFTPTEAKPINIHVDDLPMLEKVFTDGLTPDELLHVRFKGLKEGSVIPTDQMDVYKLLIDRKVGLANRLVSTRAKRIAQHPMSSFAGEEVDAALKNAKGFKSRDAVVFMSPEDFLKMAESGTDMTKAINVAKHAKFNSIPSLSYDLTTDGVAKVIGHEGRHRARELIKRGVKRMPVTIRGGIRFDQQMDSRLFDYIDPAKYPKKLLGEKTGEIDFPVPQGKSGVLFGEEAKQPMRELSADEIAAFVNMRSSALVRGELKVDTMYDIHADDLLAMQSHARDAAKNGIDIHATPQHIKMVYDTKPKGYKNPLKGINNFVVENMAVLAAQQRLYIDGLENASSRVLGKRISDRLPDLKAGVLGVVDTKATTRGAGATLGGAENNNYGTLANMTAWIGKVTADTINEFKSGTKEVLDPLLNKLSSNKEAAIEWSVLNAKIRGIGDMEYALNETGDALEPAMLVRLRAINEQEAAEGALEFTELSKGAQAKLNLLAPEDMLIPLRNEEVRNLAAAHIELNGKRTVGLAGIRAAQGLQMNRGADVFYPIPVDPRDFKHFGIVIDQSITSGNHHRTIFANSEEELQGMIYKLRQNPQLKVLTKKQAEDYYSSTGQWSFEKTLSSNYLDTEAKRLGVSSPYLPATDPDKIVKDLMQWHMNRETGLVREAVSAKYEVVFDELRRMGDEFTDIATSKFGNLSLEEFAESVVKNPYVDYIKTALGVRRTSDYPMLTNINKWADDAFSKMWSKIDDVANRAKSVEELKDINRIMKESGYQGAAYDADMEIFANAQPVRGVLSEIVQNANNVIATVTLRWDTLNAINNAVSANVLLGAETKAVLRAIFQGGKEAEQAIGALAYINVPGTDKTIFSAQKLIANSIRKFGTVGRDSAEFKWYEDRGYMTRISDQYRNVLDDLAYKGSLTDLQKGTNKAFKTLKDAADKGEELTGNRLAEEFNRFVAADVMKQLTDVAVSRNLMTAKEQLAYINTFVNRTQGNYTAAQRPMLFQGPIGQAVSLFQTYQFNLMQQLLRHVGEGRTKDWMTLLALQGTIHGMNGLPAFNAVNEHIIGTASGNIAHRDAYDATYGILGKNAGDWLMYGVGSNALGLLHPDLKTNLYVRGDINPRHVTILPSSPANVPMYQASAKFFANLFSTAEQIMAGADVSTALLQGLEHNGLSRPLAGLAQTLQGLNNPEYASYSTSNKGNVIAVNDLLSLANLSRMVGGKPLDEAIALDATYRFKAYGLDDYEKRETLGRAIKTTMMAGNNPTREQVQEFAQKYVEAGGKQREFNQWFTQLYQTANTSQANELQKALNDPFTKAMQELMGDRTLRDFSND